MKESGYSTDEVAQAAKVGVAAFTRWLRGDSVPTLGEARALAKKLKRPLATFLLPSPPKIAPPKVEFRRPAKGRRQLNPDERLRLREAGRLQLLFAWVSEELSAELPDLGRFSTTSKPETAAKAARGALGISTEQQLKFSSASAAWRGWREAVEHVGVYVVAFPMGLESCRGFSIWNDHAPLIAVNSSWNAEARIFTLLHEFAHLLSRTNSACLETASRPTSQGDDVERWCENVAALVLIPDTVLSEFIATSLQNQPRNDLNAVTKVAKQFKTSRRAAALRLIEAEYADWSLYRSIPAITDHPKKGGGGGSGRTRDQLRADQYGVRAIRVISTAVQRDVLTVSDAIDYLHLSAVTTVGSYESRELF